MERDLDRGRQRWLEKVQAELRGNGGWVPDHYSKVNVTVKPVR